MRWRHALTAAAFAFLCRPAAAYDVIPDRTNRSITPDMHALPIRAVGRVQATPLAAPMPVGAKAYRHEWAGVYFESAFIGDRVTLKFDDSWHEYRLLVDDDPPISIVRPGKAEILVNHLGRRRHRLRLEKVSESFSVPGLFAGFYVPTDARPLRASARRRQIEFIGPSGMTGFGIRSTTADCTEEEVRRTTDTQQAYSVLAARRFGADYQINAMSGRGLIRNLQGARHQPALVALYPFTFSDRTVPYRDPRWQPQIIVIDGFVDFAGEPEAGERWKTIDAFFDDWVQSYRDFVADLHRRSPRAAFILDWPEDQDIGEATYRAKFAAAKQALAADAKRKGIRMMLFASPNRLRSQLEMSGCKYHGSLKDNRLLADWLIAIIDAHPGIWNRQ
jgi:hypothetical protein